jgi:hypothetical protein
LLTSWKAPESARPSHWNTTVSVEMMMAPAWRV